MGFLAAAAACLGKGREATGAHVILGGLGEAGGGGGFPAACRQGSQLCHCDSVAGGQGSSHAAVPTASSTGTIWARPCPAFPLGHSGLISNNFLLPQAGNTPPTQALACWVFPRPGWGLRSARGVSVHLG